MSITKKPRCLPVFLSPCCVRGVALGYAVLVLGFTSLLHAGETDGSNITADENGLSLSQKLLDKKLSPEEHAIIHEIVESTQSVNIPQTHAADLNLPELMDRTKKTQDDHEILLFVSDSLGEASLKAIFSEASLNSATVLFRGIPKDAAWLPTITSLQQLASKFDPIPEIVIDPTAFVHYKVTSVPTLILRQHDKVIKRVQGVYSIDWLLRQVDKTATAELGVRGPISDISEPDLIAVMQQKTLDLDGQTLIEQAKARFWQQIPFIELPTAPECLQVSLDPTVTLTRPLKDATGKIILPALTRINPLAQLPFTQTLVIFDATNDLMREAVKNFLSQKAPHTTIYTLITTKLNREKGWQALAEYESQLGLPLYLLPNSIRTRFAIDAIPTIITANSEHFLIETGCIK